MGDAARAILSITELYGRRVDLNLVTGASLAETVRIGDRLEHDRYARLQEYAGPVGELLGGRRVTRDGPYYPVEDLHMGAPVNPELRPRLYVAGDSAGTRGVGAALGATAPPERRSRTSRWGAACSPGP